MMIHFLTILFLIKQKKNEISLPIFENKITKKKDIILKKFGIISDKDLPKFDLISEIPKKKDIALPKISELIS